MSYTKYYLYKKQYSTDSGQTWHDAVPEETVPSGDPIGHYETLEECEQATPPTGTSQPLTLIPSGTFSFYHNIAQGATYVANLDYSTDSGATWVSLHTQETSPQFDAGTKIMLRYYQSTNYKNGFTIVCANRFAIEGNIMSLVYGKNFTGQTEFTNENYTLTQVFKDNTLLTNIDNIVMPATALTEGCYSSMFQGCTRLTSVPSNLLPATTLTPSCYANMFNGCKALTNVPTLLATTLTHSCYDGMFQGCTSLTSVPNNLLPATNLYTYCYHNIFNGCTALTNAPELPATDIVFGAYKEMFAGCTSLTTAPSLAKASEVSAESCNGMFSGCTSLTTAPSVLPAMSLQIDCYGYMFADCTSLATAPELPALVLSGGIRGCYQYMFKGCTNLNYVKCLAIEINGATKNWLDGVSATGTFVKDSEASWPTGVSGIPDGWTVQDA